MQALRHARFLARLVLAWFALSLVAAAASPLVNPHSLEVVCSAAGTVKLVEKTDVGSDQPVGHAFDCALCLHAGFPPAVTLPTGSSHPLSYALRPVVSAHLAGLTGAPLPARGPPASA